MNIGITIFMICLIFIICHFIISKYQIEEKYDNPRISTIHTIYELLSKKSPYFDIHRERVNNKIDSIIKLFESREYIEQDELLINIRHILSELGDRHASIEKITPEQEEEQYYLPFSLAPWIDNQVIALRQLPKLNYSFYLENYPLLSEIQDENINTFILRHDILNKYAPKRARLSLGVEKMNEFYQVKDGLKIGDSIKLKFLSKNRKKDTLIYSQLVNFKTKWREINKHLFPYEKTKKSYSTLQRSYEDGIAYLRLPKMYNKSENELFFQWLTEYMNSIQDATALIIDIRNNSGGSRDIINFFSNYFIKPNDIFVANMAKYKGKVTNLIRENLNKRNLYPLDHFSRQTQNIILQERPIKLRDNNFFENANYSSFHYMVLKNNEHFNNYYFFDKPVYFMINELTFSAASVFASSFKNLENITLAGVNSDGSSGLAQSYELSGLRLKFSHMLSFQKNGNLFDGIGTDPDIEINRSIDQIFGIDDYQLDVLLTEIKKQN